MPFTDDITPSRVGNDLQEEDEKNVKHDFEAVIQGVPELTTHNLTENDEKHARQ
jgi:hypothetical protein